ncbi:hypothetical protein SDC9_202106 [bioreactor metagenome]|uniref:Uncharacterized protein n=1 Tax=bioreactor metagenome TaxID=1076179 RepID=A0A645ITE4_9ZZZZ
MDNPFGVFVQSGPELILIDFELAALGINRCRDSDIRHDQPDIVARPVGLAYRGIQGASKGGGDVA